MKIIPILFALLVAFLSFAASLPVAHADHEAGHLSCSGDVDPNTGRSCGGARQAHSCSWWGASFNALILIPLGFVGASRLRWPCSRRAQWPAIRDHVQTCYERQGPVLRCRWCEARHTVRVAIRWTLGGGKTRRLPQRALSDTERQR